jgi:hypothetical protein
MKIKSELEALIASSSFDMELSIQYGILPGAVLQATGPRCIFYHDIQQVRNWYYLHLNKLLTFVKIAVRC